MHRRVQRIKFLYKVNSYNIHLEPLLINALNVNSIGSVHLCKYMIKNIIPSEIGHYKRCSEGSEFGFLGMYLQRGSASLSLISSFPYLLIEIQLQISFTYIPHNKQKWKMLQFQFNQYNASEKSFRQRVDIIPVWI
jgi:hypothetical protein